MKISSEIELDFSDVLILPQRSDIPTRNISVDRTFKFRHANSEWEGFPVIASNMLTGSFKMAEKLAEFSMMTALHKHHSIENLVKFWSTNEIVADNFTFYTLGIRDEDLKKYNQFCETIGKKPNFVCIDIANGHIEIFADFVRKFRANNPEPVIMAGNVVTGSMTEELILAGADIVKVGIGSGANCLTRRIAGVGRPQLSAVLECANAAHGLKGLICSDGGIVQPADVNVAFCAGTDFVMIGTMFSGTDECDGEIVEHNGKFHKKFYGMSSNTAMEEFNQGRAKYKSSEGRTTLIPCKGSVGYIAEELQGATRSMMAYIGAAKLKEVSKRANMVRVNRRLNTSVEQYTIGN